MLRPGANEISILNVNYEFDRVEVYRRDAPDDSLRFLATATFPAPPDMRSFASTFRDSLGASLASRYEFRPFSGADAHPRLPVLYVTSDSTYAASVESTPPGR